MIVEKFEDFIKEAAKDHRFKYVISKDYKNHGVVDFVKGDQFYVEIDADGNTVPYSYKDVWILDKEDTDKLTKAMMKGTLKPDSSPKELKAFVDKHIGKKNESVNEGIFSIFKKKRKKEIEKKEKANKYNPKQIYYGHPDFKKEFPGFSEDPEKEIDESFKTLDVAEKKTIPLINEMTVDLEHIREMMTQKDMVNNDTSNAEYVVEIDIFLNQLKDVDFKLRKGIW